MYDDTIKIANKIISTDDLIDIFSEMNDKLQYYKKISYNEEIKNKTLSIKYQKYTFKDYNSKLTFKVTFTNDTKIEFDDYNKFIGVFNYRSEEIECIYVFFKLHYGMTKENGELEYHRHDINMYIYETKISVDLNLDSSDNKINDVYELIQRKLLNAPIKYDNIIKKKSSIITTCEFAFGFIPAVMIVTLISVIIPTIGNIFAESYILYPITCLVLTLLIGGIALSNRFDKLYKNIVPEKRYAGYKNGAIYKDDINKYVGTCEVLIGKNVNNMECRKK